MYVCPYLLICLIGISNSICPKQRSKHSSHPQTCSLTVFPFQEVADPSFTPNVRINPDFFIFLFWQQILSAIPSEYIQNLTASQPPLHSLSPGVHLSLGFCSRLLVGLYFCPLSTSVPNHYLNDFFVIVKGSGGSGNEARFLKPET